MSQGMNKIEFNSLMGAFATFLLFQAMGILLFEGLTMIITTPGDLRGFLIMWGFAWAFIFFFFQTILLSEVREYINNHSKTDVIAAFFRLSEWVKLFFVFSAAYLYWAIESQNIPIVPRKDLNYFWIILWHFFSWGMSILIYNLGQHLGIPFKLHRGHLLTVVVVLLVSCLVIWGNYHLAQSIHLGVVLFFGYLFMFGFTAIILEYPKTSIAKE